jgi:hypothetical protein
MRIFVVLMILLFANSAFAMEFDMEKCEDSCNGDQGCIDKCAPAEPETPVAPVQNESAAVPESNAGGSDSPDNEEGGLCGPALLLAGLAGLAIKNAEREI